MLRLTKLDENQSSFLKKLKRLYSKLNIAFLEEFDRSLPFADTLFDRWERAKELGFGEETSIYDSAFVFGRPEVGEKCWIGPNTIIDGSGGLSIGSGCTISAGVQIYTHDNIRATLSYGKKEIERKSVAIGKCTYIGPNVIITKGVKIGDYCVIGANSIVNKDIKDCAIAFGQPAEVRGNIFEKKLKSNTENEENL
jgi:acetyltransferase-like isoleucine patch superfamily enzyme